MTDATPEPQPPDRSRPQGATARRGGSPARIAGWFGAAIIGGTLAIVRVWAWLTRTPFYKD